MEKISNNKSEEDTNKFNNLKKEVFFFKDLLKRYKETGEKIGQTIFLPVIKESKLAFFEAKVKPLNKCYTQAEDYMLETTFEKKMIRLNKLISKNQIEIETINKHKKNEQNSKNDSYFENNIAYFGNKENILEEKTIDHNSLKNEKILMQKEENKKEIQDLKGQLKKLNEDLFEIIESDNEQINNEKKHQEINLPTNKNQNELSNLLQELKSSKKKYKDQEYVSFADREFL